MSESTYHPSFQQTKVERKDLIFFFFVKVTTMTIVKTTILFKLPWWNVNKQIRDGRVLYSKTTEIEE